MGRDLTLEQGYEAARLTGLSMLASLNRELGDLIRSRRRIRARWVRPLRAWLRPACSVLNGFSDLIVELWGEAGRHARSAPGQGPSPFNVPIIVDAIVAVA